MSNDCLKILRISMIRNTSSHLKSDLALGPILLCSVLMCVPEQPRVDNPSAGPNWIKAGPVSIR